MDFSPRFLGKAAADTLQARKAVPVLVIGADHFTRGDLADVECFCYVAAANLTRALGTFDVKHTRDLFERVAPSSLAIPHIGAISLAVLGAAFEKKGIGGSSPLAAWVKRHADPEAKRELVTFSTIKHQSADMAAERKERKTKSDRKSTRRNKAHRIRVDRFSKRATSKGTS